ncbi:MAG: flagellar motor protein [Gammaproteobacteria bacterium]|nr:flagellar motor protein [Gammaproteobacteria bacterium]
MEILPFVGIVMAFGAVLFGNYLDGGHLSSLLNFPAAFIVLGGTLGAVLLQTSSKIMLRAIKLSSWVFFPPNMEVEKGIEKMSYWSITARKEGLLGLESIVEGEGDPFAQKGLQMLIDGSEPESIRAVLETDITIKENRNLEAAKVFESMGGYSPTVGIIGAVLGLIHVMNNLADPSMLGAGIATAFVATVYGVGLANLVLLPFAHKIKAVSDSVILYQEMMLEGIIAISEGDNPRSMELRLKAYVI